MFFDALGRLAFGQVQQTAAGATGTLAATEAKDTAALSGNAGSAGALAASETSDTAAFAGTSGVSGALTASEAQDLAYFTQLYGPLTATEAKDTAAIAAQALVNWNSNDKSSDIALSGGNLIATRSTLSSSWESVRATIPQSTTSWVFSVTLTKAGSGVFVGIGTSSTSLVTFVGNDTGGYGYGVTGGAIFANGGASSVASSAVEGDVIAVGYDGSTARWFKNGVLLGSVSATGSLYPIVSLRSDTVAPIVAGNFGPLSPAGYSYQPWQGVISPILQASEPQDSVSISGTGASGTLSATEAPDTAALAGPATITGSLAATEGKDVAAIAVDTSGLFATEAQDTASFAGQFSYGLLSATEAKDNAALSGSYNIAGTLAATEAKDTALISALLLPTGNLVASEQRDTSAIILKFKPPKVKPLPYSRYDYGWIDGRPASGGLRRRRGY